MVYFRMMYLHMIANRARVACSERDGVTRLSCLVYVMKVRCG